MYMKKHPVDAYASSFGQAHTLIQMMLLSIILLFSMTLRADDSLRSAEDAFSFSVVSDQAYQAQLKWQIPAGYYLYQHKFTVQQGSQTLALTLPKATALKDDNYGHTQVYFDRVEFKLATESLKNYQVTWQGCAQDRICYPPQTIEFKTDMDGLVMQDSSAKSGKRLVDLSSSSEQNLNQKIPFGATSNSAVTATKPLDTSVAQDQQWSEQLAQSSFFYGLLLFFGLGILLAFTPCSLPMLPILTSLIVRDSKGVKAWLIALVFVSSMATVYAILGLIASSAGLSFQRWLQQPSTLIAFSLLFVVFALNLFGLFEIKLPHALVNRLDRMHSLQKGGSLIGAAVMGMLSALLVGPCMTAPLAGALLFISQTQSQWQGAVLLFTLGFGMGTPLLLASVLGAKVLPKAGLWMNQVKVFFAFIMLALALYFIRPLLSEAWLQWLSLGLGLSFIGYVALRVNRHKKPFQWLYILALLIAVPYVTYSQYQQSQRFFVTQNSAASNAIWHVAKTAAEFQQLLNAAPSTQAIVIDVYADWCVACQPIEQRILKSAAVQQALSPYYLIKLDLSSYDAAHQALLNQWDILGPPTYLFLDGNAQEIRTLRLTGAFSEAELRQQIKRFAQALEQ